MAPAGIAPPTGPAGPTALEAHERVGGHAATRQSVLVRAVIASYTQPTQIEIPIPSFCASLARPGEASAVHEDADTVQQVIGLCRLRGVGRHPFERHRSGDQVIDLEGQAGRDGIERGRGGVQRLGGV